MRTAKAVDTAAADAPPLTVLVADDEPLVVDILQGLLEGAGCRVMTASDGGKVVEVFRENAGAIGCVILDLSMPQLSGIEAARRIRAIRGDTPIILASGSDKTETNQHLDGVVSACIVKPFRFDQVWSVLMAVTGRGEPK